MFWLIYLFDVINSKQLFRCNFLCIEIFKYLRTQINHGCCRPFKKSIISFVDMFIEFKFNPNSVHISCPKIISYLPLLESSTWHFHVMTFAALSAGKVKSTVTLRLVVIFPASVCHWITAFLSGFIFLTSLPIAIVVVHSLSNKIQNFLNFALRFLVFIHPCRIGE